MPRPEIVIKFLEEFLEWYGLALKDYIRGQGKIPLELRNQPGFDE